MNIPAYLRPLFEAVEAKTNTNEARWFETSVEARYRLQLQNGAIVVERFFGDDEEPDDYEFSMMDPSGRVVGRFKTYQGDTDYARLEMLTDKADRYSKGTYTVLPLLIEELQSAGKVGQSEEYDPFADE